jgi:hypothetical protein
MANVPAAPPLDAAPGTLRAEALRPAYNVRCNAVAHRDKLAEPARARHHA